MTDNVNARILRLAAAVATRFEGFKDSAEAALYYTRRIAEREECDELALDSITSSVRGWLDDANARAYYEEAYERDCDESFAPGHGVQP
jgi:hypothetical protein